MVVIPGFPEEWFALSSRDLQSLHGKEEKEMTDIKKNLLLRFLIGFCAGMVIGVSILMASKAFGFQMDEETPWSIALALICCGLYGSASVCTMILYKIDSISLLIATAIHFFVVMTGLLLLGLAMGWEFDTAIIRYVFVSYILIFILSWIIMYMVGKNRIRKMNRDLQQWKSFQSKTRE